MPKFQPDSFLVKAPTRVDLAGGTLDLWPIYCIVGGGRTLNVAIDLMATARFHVAPHSTLKVEIVSGDEPPFLFFEPMNIDALEKVPARFRFPVAIVSRYLLQRADLPSIHMRIEIETGAPLKSGLGGSSSLCVALMRGLSRVFQDFTSETWRWDMLPWVRDLEASFLKTPTGVQDYLAAIFGGMNCFEFQIGKSTQSSYPDKVLKEFSERMIVLFSGEMHESGLSNWEVYKRALENDPSVLSGLKLIQDVAEEVDLELRRENVSWMRVGGYLTQEWEMRKTLLKVSTPRLEEIENFLLNQNVLGFKVCGAASGGSFLVLCEPTERKAFLENCQKKGLTILNTRPCKEGVSFTSL